MTPGDTEANSIEARPIAVDLFCGAGGIAFGLQRAGYRILLGVDSDPSALATFSRNVGETTLNITLGDERAVEQVSTVVGSRVVDLVAGGPPCQPFSPAGEAKIRSLGAGQVDARSELWRSFVDVVARLQPRAVLIENVPAFATRGPDRLRDLVCRLEELGYRTDARILRTWHYGVPQHRRRLFVVGMRDGEFQWPRRSAAVTVRDAIGDLPRIGRGAGRPEMAYGGPTSNFQALARVDVAAEHTNLVFDHVTRLTRDDDAEAFAMMTSATKYSDLPARLRRYRADIFADKYKRLDWDQLSRTITAHLAKDGYGYIHPDESRTLTVREAARLQTFPDSYRFVGSRGAAFRQVGNAVPPRIANVLGTALLERSGVQSSTWAARRAILKELGGSPTSAAAPVDTGVSRVARRLAGQDAVQTVADTTVATACMLADDRREQVLRGARAVADKWCRIRGRPDCLNCPLRSACSSAISLGAAETAT